MIIINNFNGIGRLTRDPEMRYLESGTALTRFSIAIDRGMSKEKKDEAIQQGKQVADFINIVAWAGTAEFVANYLKKGSQVGVSGRLQSGSYKNKEGQTVYTTDVIANNITMIDWGDKEGVTPGFTDAHNEDIPF